MPRPAPRRLLSSVSAMAVTLGGLVGATVLAAPASAVTTEAIRDLDFCTQHEIPRNDDGSSDEFELPFPMTFAGAQRTSLYVNNNGNVTFDRRLSQYTPEDLTGATGNAMIAPFFADIDTRNAESALVTYGASETQFCVNWVDVGYYNSQADKLISAQLVITDHSGITGEVGDVGLEFNYSDIGWETGSASGGTDGFGGTSVAVGYTAGTGEPGTYQQFTGSLVNGALIDGGPHALVASSRNSDVLGRYTFYLGGEGIVQEGSLVGTVTDEDGTPVSADIIVCEVGTSECVTTLTSAAGSFSVVGLPAGDHEVNVLPLDVGLDLAAVTVPTTIRAGEESRVDVVLRPLVRGSLEVTVVDWDGEPVVGAMVEACDTVTGGCISALTDVEGRFPVGETAIGDYAVTVTAPDGSGLQNGSAEATVEEEQTTEVTVVLLPIPDRAITGVVEDQHGEWVEGATVTLAIARGGELTVLPEGSPLLHADSPSNPQTTGDDGAFGWGVVDAAYEITAEAQTCTATSTRVEEFDEEGAAHVVITLDCVEPVTEEPTTEPPTTEEPSSPAPSASPTAPGGELPATGADSTALGLALLLVAAGALVLVRRRAVGLDG